MSNKIHTIRSLNDQLRKTIPDTGDIPGQLVITHGIQVLCSTEYEPNKYLADLFRIIREYDDFHGDNDPYGEHDFGSFEFMKQGCFWKFDYYDHDLLWASSDPSDVTKTMRVLTIMCADEY